MLIPGVSQRSPTKTSSHTFPRPCRATRPRIVTTSLNGISHQLLSNPRLLLAGAWARRPAAGYVCWDGGGRRRPPQQKRRALGARALRNLPDLESETKYEPSISPLAGFRHTLRAGGSRAHHGPR